MCESDNYAPQSEHVVIGRVVATLQVCVAFRAVADYWCVRVSSKYGISTISRHHLAVANGRRIDLRIRNPSERHVGDIEYSQLIANIGLVVGGEFTHVGIAVVG